MRLVTTVLTAALVILPIAATGQEGAPAPRLGADPRVADAIAAWSAWVDQQLAATEVPGASFAIVADQELLGSGGFGLADPDTGRRANADTAYSICSISKLFTSIAVMQLRDRGALSLDAPLSDYVDWVSSLADVNPDDEKITLRRVLTHSAGLPRESDFPYWTGPDFDFPSRAQIRARLADQETLYPSGRYFQYSNLGLTLAGEVVAAVSGEGWAEYVQQQILTPLGMESTWTSVPAAAATGRLAAGYSALRGRQGRERLHTFDAAGISPAAGMVSTAADLARFGMWQLRLREAGGEEVLRSATLREMQRVHWVDPDWKTTWGLGFGVTRRGDRTFVGHSGACPGYYTTFRLAPADGMAVAVLSNAIGADVQLYAEKAVALVAPQLAKARKGPPETARDPALDRYTGVYDSVWGRAAMVRWEDGLAVVDLDTRSPEDGLEKLKQSGEHAFRRVREDDDTLGETWTFAVDEHGEVASVTVHSNVMRRVGPLL